MKHDQLDPQIEKLLNGVKLKEPKQRDMTNYLSQVRSKITIQQNQTQFHFVPFGVALVVILVLSGLIYWAVQNQSKGENPMRHSLSSSAHSKIASSASHPRHDVIARGPRADEAIPNSLEEEMAILEAFSDEYPNGTGDVLSDEETVEDLVLIDEIEFAIAPTQGTSFNT